MDLNFDITLPALKFLSSETEHICRLCFSSTQDREVSLEDNVRLQKSFLDETVTYADMFSDLSVSA